MTEFLVYLVTIAAIWTMLTLSLNLQYGLAGLVNLGHVASFMLGAYASAILVVLFNQQIVVGMIGGTIVAALFGMIMALPTAELKQDYWAISTLAVAEIVRLIFLNTTLGSPFVGQAFGISGIPRPLREWFAANGLTTLQYNVFYLVLVLVILLASFLLLRWLSLSPFGRTLKAIREGDEVPLAFGKHVGGFRIRAMAIGGAIAGLAGALFAHYNGYIGPEYFMPVETFIIWTMVILGGSGNFLGSLVGTFIIIAISNSTRFLAPLTGIDAQLLGSLRMIFIGLLTLLVVLFMPRGILPEGRRRFER
jgi:branched-chain amino acid transport system permease protein